MKKITTNLNSTQKKQVFFSKTYRKVILKVKVNIKRKVNII